jgi:signal transduction histidine kinase
LQQALDASDSERRRIAADLHDGVVQNLAGVAYSMTAIARDAALKPPDVVALGHSAADVQEAIRALRSLLVEIYPPNLAETGLETALTDLLARVNGRGVAASLHTSESVDELPAATAGLIYRITQEALRNVVTHANATSVAVRVDTSDGNANVDVVDDGVGFDPEAAVGAGHLGLRGLTDLVADVEGHLHVESAAGKGTSVHATVPIR